ncbi:GNAT family N-acetyltransferase [Sphingomonas sp. M1-B02]|uniref:GNAT family N-acetyltransferase n=1 Tax=Sphingomonas sp. M1-B02 TaxID=3114300 RepID=UPI002240AF4E|nr:GNAT family N-acetyltransferase [Sphingomonas sp. S6-11]UZK67344.1 GNAT family N-acetyltransferase [Sphingomonas sp. S6-11]
MFARTPRLTLRPGWPEDAPALAQAIGHECVVRNLARAPWPYPIEAAETFAASFATSDEPVFLLFEHDAGAIRLVGGIGLHAIGDEPHELGYWVTPNAWGRGYATEAGKAVLQVAKAIGVRRVTAGHFIDNPASGRVLRKLGFRPTGRIVPQYSRGRGAEVPSARFELDLSEDDNRCDEDPHARMAA